VRVFLPAIGCLHLTLPAGGGKPFFLPHEISII
jgi:hypothetical protein